jgi:hypothetical protein
MVGEVRGYPDAILGGFLALFFGLTICPWMGCLSIFAVIRSPFLSVLGNSAFKFCLSNARFTEMRCGHLRSRRDFGRHHFGRFTIPFSGFPSHQFWAPFWAPLVQDVIWLKPSPGLSKVGFGRFLSSLRVPRECHSVGPGNAYIQATENPEHGKQAR